MALSIFRFSAFQINKNVINRLSLCGLRYMSTSTAKDNDTSNIPEPPKRPPTSYILFLTSKREEVKNKHPGIGNLELVKMVGKMWRELEKKEKEKFKKTSEKEREKYNKEYNDFLAKMTEEQKIQFQNSVLTFKRERRAKNEYKKYQRIINSHAEKENLEGVKGKVRRC